ncbi:MAG: hypothetical protein M9962_11075 [Oligoflexia bacterium]|nr:hypothetical protein [Oligoflexia bacterium]
MPRKYWLAKPSIHLEPIRESEFIEILAELGAIVYGELSSCQLQNKSIAPDYTSNANESERKLINAK